MAVTVVTKVDGYGQAALKLKFESGTGSYVKDGHLSVYDQTTNDIAHFAPERWLYVFKDDTVQQEAL